MTALDTERAVSTLYHVLLRSGDDDDLRSQRYTYETVWRKVKGFNFYLFWVLALCSFLFCQFLYKGSHGVITLYGIFFPLCRRIIVEKGHLWYYN